MYYSHEQHHHASSHHIWLKQDTTHTSRSAPQFASRKALQSPVLTVPQDTIHMMPVNTVPIYQDCQMFGILTKISFVQIWIHEEIDSVHPL